MPGRWQDEAGQALPLVLIAIVGLMITAVALTQGGRLTELRATAVTAADAAALAGADALADALEGPGGIAYLASGAVAGDIAGPARQRAEQYAEANDSELDEFSVVSVDRRTVVVRVTTRTAGGIGEPSIDEEMADTRGRAEAAAVVELTLHGAPSPGCLTLAEAQAVAEDAGLDPPDSSGLVSCGSADTRNLRTAMQEAVLRVEDEMGADLSITHGFVSFGEQLDRWRGGHPLPPGATLLNWGLALETSDHAALQGALSAMADPPLCRPHPATLPAYASHADHDECGGLSPRPAPGHIGIEATDPYLIDPARLD